MIAVDRPLLVYDGLCRFCRRWVDRWHERTGARVDYVALQEPGLLRRLGIPLSEAVRSVQLVTPAGRRFEGADAILRVLGDVPGLRAISRIARLVPARWLAAWAYRRIARHRDLAAGIDRVLFGSATAPPGTALVRAVFTRALGGVFLIAFASLHRQVLGLYGERGIQPIGELLAAARSALPARERMREVPSLFWLDASDRTLVRACLAGEVCAVLMMLGIAPRWTAAAMWALYLSFVSTGRDFLSFQWDALLLETGLAAAIIAPPGRRHRDREAPPWTATALMRLLVFRLYFESGLVKLTSGDPTWRDATACTYHYATQPLPTRLGWFAHHLPRRAQRISSYLVIALELGAPMLAFAPRGLRRTAFAVLAGLQLLIAATGNYGFFNLLTVVDSLWLLDDAALARTFHVRTAPPRRAPWWRRIAVAVAALPLVAISAWDLITRARPRTKIPRPLAHLHAILAPLRAVNPYGLFAVMTTTRPEIVIEGSPDGRDWREYHLRYKPGDVRRPPRLVAPHQPRLDWQLWFAALGAPPRWFADLLVRLLEGAPDVLALFDGTPFPDAPPTYVRALLYEYRMTDRETRRSTGAWWQRELRGIYVPPVQLAPAP